MLTLSAITGAVFDESAIKEADFKVNPPASKRVDHRDFLICRGNGNLRLVGLGFFPRQDLPGVIFPDTMIALRVDNSRIDRKYLEFVWRSKRVRAQIEAGARTTNGTFKINQRVVESIQIPAPPIEDQRRLAVMLGGADELRAKRRQSIALLDDLAESIFVEMFGDPRSNPHGWPVKNLGLLGQVQGGLQVTSRRKSLPLEVPYLRVANVYRNCLDLQEIKVIKVTKHELERTRLRKEDLLVVEGHGNREEIGRVAQWDGSIADCVHQNHLIRVRLDDDILPEYACALLNSQGGRVHLLRSANTTSGLNTISSSDVRAVPVILPPFRLQAEFVAKINRLRQLQANLDEALRALDEMFGSLQARAFNGEL